MTAVVASRVNNERSLPLKPPPSVNAAAHRGRPLARTAPPAPTPGWMRSPRPRNERTPVAQRITTARDRDSRTPSHTRSAPSRRRKRATARRIAAGGKSASRRPRLICDAPVPASRRPGPWRRSAAGGKPVHDARPDLALSGAARHDAGVPEVLREAFGFTAERPLLVARAKGLEESPASFRRGDDTIASTRQAQHWHRETSNSRKVIESLPPRPLSGPVPLEPLLEHTLRLVLRTQPEGGTRRVAEEIRRQPRTDDDDPSAHAGARTCRLTREHHQATDGTP